MKYSQQENHHGLLDFLKQLSLPTVEILLRYPDWRAAVFEAFSLPPLPLDTLPTIIEIFDQQGLLAGKVNDHTYTVQLDFDHVCEFTAWYFDGSLVLFCVGAELVVNRLTHLAVAALFDLPTNYN